MQGLKNLLFFYAERVNVLKYFSEIFLISTKRYNLQDR